MTLESGSRSGRCPNTGLAGRPEERGGCFGRGCYRAGWTGALTAWCWFTAPIPRLTCSPGVPVRYDYIVHQELCLGIGRVLSIGCFLLLAAPMNQMLLARIVVAVAGAAPMLIWAAFARIPQRPPAVEMDARALPAAA